MGFSVTISEGQERGREYTFKQTEVSIGRVAENDIVLGDAGVSRKHVLIREDSGKFFVQDLGSANGTKLNGNAITEEELQDGDEISVGPVVFAFTAMPDAGENSTRIFNAAELDQKIQSTKAAKAKASAAAASNPKARAQTSMSPAIPGGRPRPKTGTPAPGAKTSGPNALVKASPSGVAKKPSAPPGKLAPASDRLRAQREAKTLGAKLKLKWSQLPDKAQKAGILVGAVVGIGILGKVIMTVADAGKGQSILSSDESTKVFDLTGVPTKDCYGLGSGATHQTSDKAQFSFNFPVTAKKAIATLKFTAGSVGKTEEVDISVGAVHQGFVNRSFGDDQRAQEVALSPKYLKPNDKNNIVFDNLKNPPGQEPWVICAVAVDVQQLPAGTEGDLRDQARADILNGDRFYQDRLIAAPNRYNAWKAYKRALLYLEAMETRIDEYDVVKQKIRDTEREMDEECSKIMLNGAAAEKQNKITDAISQYKHGLQFFPEKDFACYGSIRGRLENLE